MDPATLAVRMTFTNLAANDAIILLYSKPSSYLQYTNNFELTALKKSQYFYYNLMFFV